MQQSLKRFAFFFLFAYIILYAFSYQFVISGILNILWGLIVPPFSMMLGAEEPATLLRTGSGDTFFNYYQLILFALLAIVIALVLQVMVKKERTYEKMVLSFRILIRYYLAAQMLTYGLAKIYYLQFSAPSDMRLDQPLGEFSPMGLLWTFMGYSKTYTVFTGVMEFVGGVLLLFRRTSTLGALVTFGVMVNVMMMNYCYDVPVKLLSTHMVAMSLVLMAFDAGRILNFFFNLGPVENYYYEDIVSPHAALPKNALKGLLIFCFIGFYGSNMISSSNKRAKRMSANKTEVTGIYDVIDMQIYRDSSMIRTIGDNERWKRFYITPSASLQVALADKNRSYKKMSVDTLAKKITYNAYRDTNEYILNYNIEMDSILNLSGRFNYDSIQVKAIQRDRADHLLVNRKFHWIQNYPFNR